MKSVLLKMVVLTSLVLAFAPASASAADVTMKLSVIEASKKAGQSDAALSKIMRSLKRAFGNYKSFKQLDKKSLALNKGKKRRITLPNGQVAELTYTGKKGAQHSLKLAVPKSKVSVNLRMKPGKMFYQAGLRGKKKGTILVLGFYLKPGS